MILCSMASDLAREESFRTSLRNQKRRLSTPDRKPSLPDTGLSKAVLAGVSKRDSLTPPGGNCLTPPRIHHTPPRYKYNGSKQNLETFF